MQAQVVALIVTMLVPLISLLVLLAVYFYNKAKSEADQRWNLNLDDAAHKAIFYAEETGLTDAVVSKADLAFNFVCDWFATRGFKLNDDQKKIVKDTIKGAVMQFGYGAGGIKRIKSNVPEYVVGANDKVLDSHTFISVPSRLAEDVARYGESLINKPESSVKRTRPKPPTPTEE